MSETLTPKMKTYAVRGTSTVKARLMASGAQLANGEFLVTVAIKRESDLEAIRHAQTIHLLLAE